MTSEFAIWGGGGSSGSVLLFLICLAVDCCPLSDAEAGSALTGMCGIKEVHQLTNTNG